MYIKQINVRNFRKFGSDGITLNFNKGINILIGENNAGKSTIIDVLRVILNCGQYRKAFYVGVNDFHINSYGKRESIIDIDVFFEGLTEEQQKAFYSLIDIREEGKAQLHIQYTISKDKKGKEKVKEKISGGPNNVIVDREVFDNINSIFLPALRDVENELKPSKTSQLANLLNTFVNTEEEKEKLVKLLEEANTNISKEEVIRDIEKTINENLELIEKAELNQKVKLSLLPPSFDEIAGALNIWYRRENKFITINKDELKNEMNELSIDSIADELTSEIENNNLKVDLEKMRTDENLITLHDNLVEKHSVRTIKVSQNGLGYNNLLSMAATMGDLQRQPIDEEYSVLLVEEPEAHLHPQLLDLLFNFFKETNSLGNVQVFMTSHSPTLVAKANLDDIHMVYGTGKSYFTSLRETNLLDEEKDDLKRYLDVTKSQLFFAKRILMVEGISEAILINEFARLIGKPLDKFSIEILNINGVAFEPFLKIFKKSNHKKNLNIPCAVLTDNDKCTNANDKYRIEANELSFKTCNFKVIEDKILNGEISTRASKLLKYNGDNIKIFLAEKTLEYEISNIKENNNLILEILGTLHSTKAKKISEAIQNQVSQEQIAIMVWVAVRESKGVFAQKLAAEISKIIRGERAGTFVVPSYIKDAIGFLVER